MSTRLTWNRGFDAVAMTVIRYRSSAGLTATSPFCHGCPVGTKTTSSSANRSATSLAATRWPWWIGSNVPPMIPNRRFCVMATRIASGGDARNDRPGGGSVQAGQRRPAVVPGHDADGLADLHPRDRPAGEDDHLG